MAISRAALTALIAANIADNTSEAITPALHRAVENALNDSNVNWIDDVKTTLNNSNNEIPTSGAVAALIGTLSIPLVPQMYSVTLTAADLSGGVTKEILPAVSGYFWAVLDCQAKVNWNTTGFDTSSKIEVFNETATNPLYTFDNLDQLIAGSMILRGLNIGIGDVTGGEQYIANTRLVAQCMNPPTAGDGTAKIYVTAQLVQA